MKEKREIYLYIYLKCLYPVDFPLTASSREDAIKLQTRAHPTNGTDVTQCRNIMGQTDKLSIGRKKKYI